MDILSGKRAVHGGVICRWKRKVGVIRIVSEVWITGAVKEEGLHMKAQETVRGKTVIYGREASGQTEE